MIPYEIQLRYVIRDKIQSETNSVQEKIQSGGKFCQKKNFIGKKILRYFPGLNFVSDCILSQTEFVSDFQCTFLSCLRQIDAYHY